MIANATKGGAMCIGGGNAHLAALRDGDAAAWEAFVRRHGPRMLATARRFARGEDEAEDVVQEAFAQAFKALKSFRADAQISTWLHRIVVNAALMRRRSASRRPETSLDDLLPTFDSDGHHASPIPTMPDDPESLVGRAEVRIKIRRCIDELPESHRTVILLRDIEELDTAETAEILGVSENAVKVRLHRARQALATLFSSALAGEASSVSDAGSRRRERRLVP
jgi:RNA polymerase sigma-70 factor (ECF subfamily)